MDYFFYLKNYIDKLFLEKRTGEILNLDVESIVIEFRSHLTVDFTDAQFCILLMVTGFIPDMYPNDSSQETLYSKLVEVLVCEWAHRMGFKSDCIKQKASFEDVVIFIENGTIVCDAKSFRLGRSQAAPNVKDFLKLEDIRKWLSRYENQLGGLVTYPDTHEWRTSSDVYQYCSSKSAPTVMLPYKYLALLLNFKDNYVPSDLKNLWNYDLLFPKSLKKDISGGNKNSYWNVINKQILSITGIKKKDFDDFLDFSNMRIYECICANLDLLEKKKKGIVSQIRQEVYSLHENQLRESLINTRIKSETAIINNLINRIKEFRL